MSSQQPNGTTRHYRVALSRQSSNVELLRRDRKSGDFKASPSDFADFIAFTNHLLLKEAKRNTKDQDVSTCAILYFGLPIAGLAIFVLGVLPSLLRDMLVVTCVIVVTGFLLYRSLRKKKEAERDEFTEQSAYVEVKLEHNLSENYTKLVELLRQSVVSEKIWLSFGDPSYEKDDIKVKTASDLGPITFSMPFVLFAPDSAGGWREIAFLPTGMLVKYKTRVDYWSLDSIECVVDSSGYWATYREGSSPSDSSIGRAYWKHARIDGGPDRRYNYNYREVLIRHELVRIKRGSVNIQVIFSKMGAADKFVTFLNRYREYVMTGHSSSRGTSSTDRNQAHAAGTGPSTNTGRGTGTSESYGAHHARQPGSNHENAQYRNQHHAASSSSPIDAEYAKALSSLELNHNATASEARTAYRRLSQLYHPDKVQHLAPEYKEISENKMREINAAYDLVIKRLS